MPHPTELLVANQHNESLASLTPVKPIVSPVDETFDFTATTYPSNCLRFLQEGYEGGRSTATVEEIPIQAERKLRIVIVGAGLGGLATAVSLRRRGHHVEVYEQAAQLLEVRLRPSRS